MKRVFAMFAALTVLLTLSACQKKTEEPAAPPAPPVTEETTAAALPEPVEVQHLLIPAEKTQGRLPDGEYDLPEEVVSMQEWQMQGAVALLAREGDVSFYGVEGKESTPALLRWGRSLGEFDWLYATPRAVEPELWLYDMDGDGEEEVVVSCYGGSGTGVSLEFLHVVKKQSDGSLTGYALPWETLVEALNERLQTVTLKDRIYAVLGRELVDMTALLEGPAELGVDLEGVRFQMGEISDYRLTEDGVVCSFGIVAEGENIPPLALYAGTVEGAVRYKSGAFVLEELHLLS